MVAKAYHKHVRRKAIPHLQEYAVDSQCGGLKSRATDIAALAVRAFLDKCKAQGRSAATLFLDIKAAFDSAMRELLLPMDDPDAIMRSKVMDAFTEDEKEFIQDRINGKNAAEEAGVPPYLAALMADLHAATLFEIQGADGISGTDRKHV